MDDAELDELMDDIVEVIELHDQLHPSEPDDKEILLVDEDDRRVMPWLSWQRYASISLYQKRAQTRQ